MEEKEIDSIDIKELLYTLWKKRFLIILFFVIGIILGFVYTRFVVTPMYQSKTSLVLAGTSNKEDSSITSNDLAINSKLVSTYGEIVKSRTVAEKVIDELGLNMSPGAFIENVSINSKTGTDLIEIVVSNENGSTAASIANKIAEVFTEKVKEIYKIENVSVIDRAEESIVPYNVSLPKNIMIFSMAGIILVCGIIFITMLCDNTVKGQDDVERLLDIPVIAVIPKMED